MFKYLDDNGNEFSVYIILAVEERDKFTMSLIIDRPSTQDKHIISREAYVAHRPREKDYLAFDANNVAKIIAKDELSSFGTIKQDVPTLSTPDMSITVTSGLSSEDGSSTAKEEEVVETPLPMSLAQFTPKIPPLSQI